MAYFRIGAAIVFLVCIASCASNEATDLYGMPRTSMSSSMYARDKPAPMDASRRVAKADCTKPVVVDHGNLLCR